MMNNREKGSRCENMAAVYLQKKGYRILEKNYRRRTGEIDLIASDGDYLVFVEVKYRKNARKGEPQEAVTRAKQGKILRTAQYYMAEKRIPEDAACRFDVIACFGEELRHWKDAFGGLGVWSVMD